MGLGVKIKGYRATNGGYGVKIRGSVAQIEASQFKIGLLVFEKIKLK